MNCISELLFSQDLIPIWLEAGPGSGKTHTIVTSVEELVSAKVNPSDILCITFTNAASAELKARIIEKLGCGSGFEEIGVFTFHGFIQSLLNNQLKPTKYGTKPLLLHSLGLGYLLYTETGKVYEPDLIEELEAGIEHGNSDPLIDLTKELLDKYEATTFGKIMLEGAELIKSVQYKYVFVDEVQDINKSQQNLLNKMLEIWSCKMVMIGDSHQSIYGFRGANPIELRNLKFKCRIVQLKNNYRSTVPIATTANTWLGEAHSISHRTGAPVYWIEHSNLQERGKILADLLKIYHTAYKIPYGNSAFLYYSNRKSRLYDERYVVTTNLQQGDHKGVSFVIPKKQDSRAIQELIGILNAFDADTKLEAIWETYSTIISVKKIAYEGLDELLGILLLNERTARKDTPKVIASKLTKLVQHGFTHDTREQRIIDYNLSSPNELTIHSSKGLEFRTISLVNLSSLLYGDTQEVLLTKWPEIKRILYVAMTRAVDVLFISIEPKVLDPKYPWTKALLQIKAIANNVIDAREEYVSLLTPQPAKWKPPIKYLLDSNVNCKIPEFETHSSIVGTLVHKCLHICSLNLSLITDILNDTTNLDKLYDMVSSNSTWRLDVLKYLLLFFSDDINKPWLWFQDSISEYAFLRPIDESPILHSGRLDLACKANRTLYDYKCMKLPNEITLQKHKEQLVFYRKALGLKEWKIANYYIEDQVLITHECL